MDCLVPEIGEEYLEVVQKKRLHTVKTTKKMQTRFMDCE